MALTTNQAIADQVSLAYFGRPQDVGALTIFGAGLVNGSPTTAQLAAQFATAESKVVFGNSATMSTVIAKSFELVGRTATAQNIIDITSWATANKLDISQLPWEIIKIAMATEALIPPANQVVWARLAVSYQFSEDVSANSTALQNLATSTTSQDAARVVISGVTSFATISTAYPATGSGTVANFITNASTVAGSTFTLTTGVDNLVGTSGNDTFTADNTGTNKVLSAADSINGGAGNDTLKVFLATGDTTLSIPTLTSVETVVINGGALTALTASTGSTSLVIESPVVNTAATYTVAGATQAVTLRGHNVTANTTTTLVYGNTATTVGLTLDGETRTAANVNTIDVSSTSVTAVNLTSSANANVITLINTGAALKTITITGDAAAALTVGTTLAAAITTVNAAASTGAVSYNASAAIVPAAFTFTGGSGNDTLTLADNALGTISSGAQLDGGAGTNDKLGLFDTALTAAETTALNATKGFEVLGLNGAITLDAASLTTFKSFAVDTAVNTTINNIQAGSSFAFNANSTTTLSPAVGVSSATVSALGGVTATLTTTGLTTIALSGTGTTGTATFAFTNSDNSSFTATGARAITMTVSNGTATGDSIDGSALTGALNATGSAQNDIIKGGTAADTLTGGAGADTITGGAGNDTFVFATRATTQSATFAGGDATAVNIDKVTDFVGNGAAAGDTIQLGITANVFGAAIQFATNTTATVTAVTVATAASFTALAAAVQAASAGVASSNTVAQAYDVTVTAGSLAGRYLIVNDDTATIATTDTIISITGATGALNAQDFTFA